MSRTSTLAVIGAGPGGYTAAFLAADLGLAVTLIDESPQPGGVCLHRGCMPSKALLHLAKLLNDAREAESSGVEFGDPRVDIDGVRSWLRGIVGKLTGGLAQLSKQRSIRYVQGRATIVDPHTMRVATSAGNNEEVRVDHVILATGSRPAWPAAFDLDSPRILDSTAALELESVPKSLLVVGGGYIGLELGTVYAALGSEVTVVEMTPNLLPGVDRDLVRVLARRFGAIAKAVHLETTVASLRLIDDGIVVKFEGANVEASEQWFEAVLIAAGRVPNSDLPGLHCTKVELDARGFVKVDRQRRTAEPSIFAVGDVAGEPMLAHKAFHEARVAVTAITGGNSVFEPLAVPAVVFTDPEIAWCGLTESQAADAKRPVLVTRFPWGASGRAITLGRPEGVTKLIVEPETHRVLGAGIVGTGAGELIAEAVVAIEMGATADDLRSCIHPHPTLSETVLESAEMLFGLSTHVYRPKRS